MVAPLISPLSPAKSFASKAKSDPNKAVSSHESFGATIRVFCDGISLARSVVLSADVHFSFVRLLAVVRVAQHEVTTQSDIAQSHLLLVQILFFHLFVRFIRSFGHKKSVQSFGAVRLTFVRA